MVLPRLFRKDLLIKTAFFTNGKDPVVCTGRSSHDSLKRLYLESTGFMWCLLGSKALLLYAPITEVVTIPPDISYSRFNRISVSHSGEHGSCYVWLKKGGRARVDLTNALDDAKKDGLISHLFENKTPLVEINTDPYNQGMCTGVIIENEK